MLLWGQRARRSGRGVRRRMHDRAHSAPRASEESRAGRQCRACHAARQAACLQHGAAGFARSQRFLRAQRGSSRLRGRRAALDRCARQGARTLRLLRGCISRQQQLAGRLPVLPCQRRQEFVQRRLVLSLSRWPRAVLAARCVAPSCPPTPTTPPHPHTPPIMPFTPSPTDEKAIATIREWRRRPCGAAPCCTLAAHLHSRMCR
jgi:hypothetical protein